MEDNSAEINHQECSNYLCYEFPLVWNLPEVIKETNEGQQDHSCIDSPEPLKRDKEEHGYGNPYHHAYAPNKRLGGFVDFSFAGLVKKADF